MGFVLIVEDDAELRNVISAALNDAGYLTWAAADGQAALTMLECGEVPDLIVLDLMMPVMNGWQFRDRQLADARWAAIPVLVLTAAEGTDASVIDATDFVRKPVELENLVERVRRYAIPDGFGDAPPTVPDGAVVAPVDLEDSSPRD